MIDLVHFYLRLLESYFIVFLVTIFFPSQNPHKKYQIFRPSDNFLNLFKNKKWLFFKKP